MNTWPVRAFRSDNTEIPLQRVWVDYSEIDFSGAVIFTSVPELEDGDYLMRDGVTLLTV